MDAFGLRRGWLALGECMEFLRVFALRTLATCQLRQCET